MSRPKYIKIDPARRRRAWVNAQDPTRQLIRQSKAECELFSVPSETSPATRYPVVVDEDGTWMCSCADFRVGHQWCKHIIEVLDRVYPDLAPPAPAPTASESHWYRNAKRQKRVPYKYKDGPAESTRQDHYYEEADQRINEHLVDLRDLLNRQEPAARPAFRPTLPGGDRVFVRMVRALHRKSIRRSKPAIQRLAEEGKIAFAPSKGSQVKYDNEERMLEDLQRAFVATTNSFLDMEQDVIIDSSGFSPFFVSCWRASKYGAADIVPGTKWFKTHIAIGRVSKAILGFAVTLSHGPGSSDGAQFQPLLVGLVASGLKLRYVIADNMYLDQANIKAAAALGATLVGPLKGRNFSNDGTPRSPIMPIAKIVASDYELYLELCRARQAVEAVFSVQKRHKNHISAIGTAAERAAAGVGDGDILFMSRKSEFWAETVRYNLSRIVATENLRGQRISLAFGTRFRLEMESTGPGGAGDLVAG